MNESPKRTEGREWWHGKGNVGIVGVTRNGMVVRVRVKIRNAGRGKPGTKGVNKRKSGVLSNR